MRRTPGAQPSCWRSPPLLVTLRRKGGGARCELGREPGREPYGGGAWIATSSIASKRSPARSITVGAAVLELSELAALEELISERAREVAALKVFYTTACRWGGGGGEG